MPSHTWSAILVHGTRTKLWQFYQQALSPTDVAPMPDSFNEQSWRILYNLYSLPEASTDEVMVCWGIERDYADIDFQFLNAQQILIECDTINDAPHPWVAFVAKQHPTLSFSHYSIYEDDDSLRVRHYTKGKQTKEINESDNNLSADDQLEGFYYCKLYDKCWNYVTKSLETSTDPSTKERLQIRKAECLEKMWRSTHNCQYETPSSEEDVQNAYESLARIKTAEAYAARANFHLRSKQYQEAVAVATKGLRSEKDSVPLLTIKMLCEDELDMKDKARTTAKKILAIDPHQAEAWLTSEDWNPFSDNAEQQLVQIEAALLDFPGNYMIYHTLGIHHYQKENYFAALTAFHMCYKLANLIYLGSHATIRLGLCCLYTNHYQLGLEYCTTTIDFYEKYSKLHPKIEYNSSAETISKLYQVCSQLYQAVKDNQAALANIDKAIKIYPTHSYRRLRIDYLYPPEVDPIKHREALARFVKKYRR